MSGDDSGQGDAAPWIPTMPGHNLVWGSSAEKPPAEERAIPAWAARTEYELKMESPEGDKAGMQVNEPLYIFDQIRNMRIGATITIRRVH